MDSYQVIEKIGQGGMGVVFRAVQSSLGREVALKLLLGGPETTTPRELQRFGREVQAIARITHPNVIRVLDFGQMDGRPFYAMEYLSKAQPLHALMKKGPLPLDTVCAIARQLLDALLAVHLLGLVHRDLKPGNVMMDARTHVTLMDFGLVKDLDATSLTKTGALMGTPRYLPPEAIHGQRVDGRADLFALGVLLHEALTGRPLFKGDNVGAVVAQIANMPAPSVRTVRSDCPEFLDAIVLKLLAKKPDERFGGAMDALQALGEGMGEQFEASAELACPLKPQRDDDEADTLPMRRVDGGLEILRQTVPPQVSDADTPTINPDASHAQTISPPREWTPGSGQARPMESTPRTPPEAFQSAPRRTRPSVKTARPSIKMSVVSVASEPPRVAPWQAAVAGLVVSALLIVGIWAIAARRPAPPVASASPAASTSPSPGNSLTTMETAFVAAVRELAPRDRIAEIRKALEPLKGKWFKNPPEPAMLELRETWRQKLATESARLKIEERVRELAAVKQAYFTDPAIPSRQRYFTYWGVNDLIDLEIYCESFGIYFKTHARDALYEGYGQLDHTQLPGEPGVGITLSDPMAALPQHDSVEPRWSLVPTSELARFFATVDAEEADIIRTLGEGPRKHLRYQHPVPLNIPLDRVDALEITGVTSDHWPQNLFEILMGSSPATLQPVAILRGNHLKHTRFWHTLDRGLVTGPKLYVGVNYRVLPDINTGNEFSYLYQLVVTYRVR